MPLIIVYPEMAVLDVGYIIYVRLPFWLVAIDETSIVYVLILMISAKLLFNEETFVLHCVKPEFCTIFTSLLSGRVII